MQRTLVQRTKLWTRLVCYSHSKNTPPVMKQTDINTYLLRHEEISSWAVVCLQSTGADRKPSGLQPWFWFWLVTGLRFGLCCNAFLGCSPEKKDAAISRKVFETLQVSKSGKVRFVISKCVSFCGTIRWAVLSNPDVNTEWHLDLSGV